MNATYLDGPGMEGERGSGSGRGRAPAARRLAVALGAAFLAGALPAAAGATDYCVAPNTGCGGTNVLSFEKALDLADEAADADRVFLGVHTYTAPTTDGYDYSQAYPVEIIGQGTGQTILTGPAGASRVFALYGGAGSWVHDLTIRLPQNAASGASGLETESTARRIEVVEDPVQTNQRFGVDLAEGGATLEDSRVTLPNAPHLSNAVELGQSGATVRRSTLSAWTAVRSHGGTIERSRLIVTNAGVAAQRGVTTLDRSVVRLTEGNGVGIYASAALGSHTTLNADGVTIVGPGLSNTDGADVFNGFAPAESVDLNLTNSIMRGFEHPLWAHSAGSGQAKIAVSYSDYDPSGNLTQGANASITHANVSNVGDARFVDPTGGDYHLLPGSPLVDAGDPASPQGLDLDGNALPADGDGDSSARRDLGAFELPAAGSGQAPAAGVGQAPAAGVQQSGSSSPDTQAPLVSGFLTTRKLFAVGRARTATTASTARGTRFRYVLSEAAQVRLTIQRARAGRYRTAGTLKRSGVKGPNSLRFSGRIGRRALRPGRYRAVIATTDVAGNRSTPRRVRFRVAPS